jgi:hypothetical protein
MLGHFYYARVAVCMYSSFTFINCRTHVTLESKICIMADLHKHSLHRKYLKQKVIDAHKLLTLTQPAVSIFR